ncbi:MAG: redoxin domain-containing protein, partial [Woeseiaceae bacterium]
MTARCTTYDIAKSQIGEYVQPLWPGALQMPFEIRDTTGRRLNLLDDHLSGHFKVLVFLNGLRGDSAAAALEKIGGRWTDFDDVEAHVIGISADSNASRNERLREESGFGWPLAGDSTGAVFASYGLHKGNGERLRIVLLTPLGQVRAYFDGEKSLDQALDTIMDVLKNSQAAEELRWAPPHAPVLLVPNVLSVEESANLVEWFEKGAPFTVRPPRPGEVSSDFRIPVYDHDRQDRVDQIVRDAKMLELLDERIWGRVAPMIKTAFSVDINRREDLHIARYAGKREGIEMGHRDNTSASTAYRRFALSMALNDDYEGGEIV